MCRKSKCAFLRANGFCLLHKAECGMLHSDADCRDGVTRAIPSKQRSFWEYLKDWNLHTVKGRFALRTRNANGHDVYRTCSSKRRFASIYAARKRAIDLKRSKNRNLLAYECPFCGGYHLTRQTRHSLLALNGVKEMPAGGGKKLHEISGFWFRGFWFRGF